MISRLLEGEFIDYAAAIPSEYRTKIILSAKEFADSINRASIIISDKIKNPVKTVFEDGDAYLSCETSQGKVSDSFRVDMEGERIKIGYNNKFMLDALRACEQDKVLIQLNHSISPIKILPLEGDSFTYLVMPMRIKEDD